MVVTVKVAAVPAMKVVASALVMLGAMAVLTFSVKDWVAAVPTPLSAVMVIG